MAFYPSINDIRAFSEASRVDFLTEPWMDILAKSGTISESLQGTLETVIVQEPNDGSFPRCFRRIYRTTSNNESLAGIEGVLTAHEVRGLTFVTADLIIRVERNFDLLNPDNGWSPARLVICNRDQRAHTIIGLPTDELYSLLVAVDYKCGECDPQSRFPNANEIDLYETFQGSTIYSVLPQ